MRMDEDDFFPLGVLMHYLKWFPGTSVIPESLSTVSKTNKEISRVTKI